ncbi:MAG: M48 family metallopeptidase [Deltaproteobacteria bacterium]|nr:M48 family metallopeptidase [Deltaproteobacteria bacterium]
MITQQLRLDDVSIDVVRKRVKYLRLCVCASTGRVRLSAPHRVEMEAVRDFAASKLDWIKKHLARFSSQVRAKPSEYVSLEEHYFNGRSYLLNVVEHRAAPKVTLRDDAYIDLYVRAGSTPEQRKAVMAQWYRRQLEARLPTVIEKWQEIIGVEVKEWRIRQMKTRWGTCAIRAQRIWINLEFAKKPEHCLEYIVVHEMVHLLERKHNDRYRAYMDRFLPQWRTYKEELNRQAGLIQG